MSVVLKVPVCRLCGSSLHQAASRGAYLKRVNEKGVPAILECRPGCNAVNGGPDDAVVHAILGDEE